MQKLWRLWHLFVLSSSSSITMVLLDGARAAWRVALRRCVAASNRGVIAVPPRRSSRAAASFAAAADARSRRLDRDTACASTVGWSGDADEL